MARARGVREEDGKHFAPAQKCEGEKRKRRRTQDTGKRNEPASRRDNQMSTLARSQKGVTRRKQERFDGKEEEVAARGRLRRPVHGQVGGREVDRQTDRVRTERMRARERSAQVSRRLEDGWVGGWEVKHWFGLGAV